MTTGGDDIDRAYFADGTPDLSEHSPAYGVETIAQALLNIYREVVDVEGGIEPNLYQETRRIFSEAVADGWVKASDRDVPTPDQAFRDAFLHSADVFSAFRVHRMQQDIAAQMIDSNGNVKPFRKFVKDVSPYIEHRNRQWLQTEYNTAILRAQNAAEWQQFMAEKDVFPNLEWIPSTSPNPGEDHRVFWGTVRPVDDPFWNVHKPGDRWNCKCELRQTEKAVTPVPTSRAKALDNAAKGLESNPAKDKEVFSDKHPYYPKNCSVCPFAGNKLMALVHDLAGGKDCHHCRLVNKAIIKPFEGHRKEYEKLKKDPNYSLVRYDKKSGGVLAIHREHNFEVEVGKFGIPRGDYERNAAFALLKAGYYVRLRSESGPVGKKQPDGYIDGVLMDIKGIEGNSLYAMNRANRQGVNTAILYFHDPALFNYKEVQEKFDYLPTWIKENAFIKDKTVYVKEVMCIVNEKSGYNIHTIKNSEE